MPTPTPAPGTAPPSSPTSAPRVRASAMPAPERRAEIVAATLPLLKQHGTALTTRQIAEAAGIAEGTIFRVFADKDALIDAVVEAAFDPAPTEAALESIDVSVPLEARLVQAVDILRRRVTDIFQLMSALNMRPTPPNPSEPSDPSGPSDLAGRRKLPGLDVLAALFEPDRDSLSRAPLDAAHVLRGLTLVGTHPLLVMDGPMTSEEIVSLVLDGVRAHGPSEGGASC